MAQNEAIFCPTGQETVRLHRSLGHQIINHNPDIAITALENELRLALDLESRIDASHNPLSRRLFITGSSVGLSCGKEA